MVKFNTNDLKIACRSCGSVVDTIGSIAPNMKNDWTKSDWTDKQISGNDLGVMTHYHIPCKHCASGTEVGVLRIDFVSGTNAELKE